ncbi:TPA: DUF371 domain-containing protein [Candidatus Woesearchaeota archaeon]|nr:DUF371 domain-containing protein [Candidatus Woesearchaeota archaeon]
MRFSFNCYGHENVLSRHRNTIEFTKDKELSKDGDCIIGVNADFDSRKLIAFVDNVERIKIVMKVEDLTEEFFAQINKDFNDSHEIVFRITEFKSFRTLGIKATKAAKDIDKELVEKMKNPDAKMNVIFEAVE